MNWKEREYKWIIRLSEKKGGSKSKAEIITAKRQEESDRKQRKIEINDRERRVRVRETE